MLRKVNRPVSVRPLPRAPTPVVREQVRKPEPALRPPPARPGLDSPANEEDEGRGSTTSLRMSAQLNSLVENIMEKRDCRKSDAIKYAIKVVGYALQHPDSSITVTTAAGETEITPLMRNGKNV